MNATEAGQRKYAEARAAKGRHRLTAKYRATGARYKTEYKARNVAFVNAYKLGMGCADCRLSPTDCPSILEFDHVPGRGEKEFEINALACKSLGMETIVAEISKCDVVCSNCHRRRTMLRLQGE